MPDVDRDYQYDVFLSYNRVDLDEVERLAAALTDPDRDLKVFKDNWFLKPGQHWPTALERNLAASRAIIIAIGAHELGPWQQREAVAALDLQDRARKADQPPPPVIPLLLEPDSSQQAGLGFLLQNTWVENWDPRAPDLLKGAAFGKAPAEIYDADHPDPRLQICPFRGLGVFHEADAPFYFGREPDLEKLSETVDQHRLAAVVGPSGCGKSSLVRAGLIPKLRRASGDKVWQIAEMIPGGDPFASAARALLPLWEPRAYPAWKKTERLGEQRKLADLLRAGGAETFKQVISETVSEEPGTTHLLLLVDQWEELYTYRPAGGEAAADYDERVRAFVQMLLDASQGDTLRVVLTLRADYWGQVLNDRVLAGRLPDSAVVHLRALDRAALEDVVRKPAQRTGLKVRDVLVERLVNDALGQPGDLALLEFALQQPWLEQKKTGANELSSHDYDAMGDKDLGLSGLARSIVDRAERIYNDLEPQEQSAVPGLFAALVQVREERTDLRRRAPLGELNAAAQRVARRFADHRLVVTGRENQTGKGTVEVAHEALLRHWPRLEDWVAERRDDLRVVRQVDFETRRWLDKGQAEAYRWSHERVAEVAKALEALKKLDDDPPKLTEDHRRFLGPIDPQEMLTELKRPETDHRRRALIGDRLAVLGDPRDGIHVDASGTPVFAWCKVPFGTVRIDHEGGLEQRVEPFAVARYPVTVAQYRAFLDAEDGWRDLSWWRNDLFREAKGDSYDIGRYANHPAVYVSWFDAMAFCRWVSERTKKTITLPDEWQWQQAATGRELERTYPWNPDDDPKCEWDPDQEPWRANTFESRLGRVTAVGMYPAGASAAGACDMAGTVFEWCLNKHAEPLITASKASDFGDRGLRGGSWGLNRDLAQCALRNWFNPFNRFNFIGFRVVCSSPITFAGR